jgi:hypothetical protein
MRTRFFRVLAVIAVVQFIITRQAAGNTVEEGRAERMWMLYPFNVLLNATLWTLVLSAGAGLLRQVRRVS